MIKKAAIALLAATTFMAPAVASIAPAAQAATTSTTITHVTTTKKIWGPPKTWRKSSKKPPRGNYWLKGYGLCFVLYWIRIDGVGRNTVWQPVFVILTPII